MVDVSRSILKEERRKNGPQGHSLTPAIKHGKETAIIQRLTCTNTQLGQAKTAAFQLYDCKIFERRTSAFYRTSVMVIELHFFSPL